MSDKISFPVRYRGRDRVLIVERIVLNGRAHAQISMHGLKRLDIFALPASAFKRIAALLDRGLFYEDMSK